MLVGQWCMARGLVEHAACFKNWSTRKYHPFVNRCASKHPFKTQPYRHICTPAKRNTSGVAGVKARPPSPTRLPSQFHPKSRLKLSRAFSRAAQREIDNEASTLECIAPFGCCAWSVKRLNHRAILLTCILKLFMQAGAPCSLAGDSQPSPQHTHTTAIHTPGSTDIAACSALAINTNSSNVRIGVGLNSKEQTSGMHTCCGLTWEAP